MEKSKTRLFPWMIQENTYHEFEIHGFAQIVDNEQSYIFVFRKHRINNLTWPIYFLYVMFFIIGNMKRNIRVESCLNYDG